MRVNHIGANSFTEVSVCRPGRTSGYTYVSRMNENNLRNSDESQPLDSPFVRRLFPVM